MYHILLVEDDPSISEMVEAQLMKEGFRVLHAFDGEEAITTFTKHEHELDLIILDIMLPKLEGTEVLKRVRMNSNIPVLILSAKDGEVDKALGLGFGADDYLAKPFSMIELVARVKANIRRARQYSAPLQKEETSTVLHAGKLRLDVEHFAVHKESREIKLTAKEFQILKLFMSHPGRVYTKAQLYSLVWEDDYYGDENVINVHMRRLREKIEDEPSNPQVIVTIWGIGYKLGELG